MMRHTERAWVAEMLMGPGRCHPVLRRRLRAAARALRRGRRSQVLYALALAHATLDALWSDGHTDHQRKVGAHVALGWATSGYVGRDA